MNRDELLKTARSRLYPSLRNPNYLVLRSRRLIFTQWVQSLKGNLTVLDVGGRYQPYRPLLEGKIGKYVALDLLPTDFVNVVGSGENIPFKDESFDLVIATVVFEQFCQPHKAASEIHRVLKPGGILMMSVASVAPRFVEEECWRYMPRGVRALLASFSSVTIAPEVSSLGGLCRLMNLAFHDVLKLGTLQTLCSLTLCPVLNIIGLFLEKGELTKNNQWTGNYSVMAAK
jgi:SAM-dependent methyltransferase